VPADLYDTTYGHFETDVLGAIRRETYGQDFGQNGWMTGDEFDRLMPSLGTRPGQHILEVATGSGRPAMHLAQALKCRVTGIDLNPAGIVTATKFAAEAGLADQVRFVAADANRELPFESDTFDALVCIDSMNHFVDRPDVLKEWHRVLRPGARAMFTDPVVISGPITSEELAVRSSIGAFLFVPPGVNERLIQEAGLHLLRQEDVSANAAAVSGRWHRARSRYRAELLRIEGESQFDALQRFFQAVELLTSERRLSRISYLVEKPA